MIDNLQIQHMFLCSFGNKHQEIIKKMRELTNNNGPEKSVIEHLLSFNLGSLKLPQDYEVSLHYKNLIMNMFVDNYIKVMEEKENRNTDI